MKEYVNEVLGSAPENLLRGRGQARTPAANDLFKVNDTEMQLPKDQSDLFHTLTAQLLFLCKRIRPDLQVAVAFLCTRVHKSTEADWRKLNRVLRYVKNTKDLFLTIEAKDLTRFRWWVDSSLNVHWKDGRALENSPWLATRMLLKRCKVVVWKTSVFLD